MHAACIVTCSCAQSEADLAFCSFECLAKSLKPAAEQGAGEGSTTEVHASAKVDVGEAQTRVQAHVRVRGASSADIEVHTSADAQTPSPSKKKQGERVENHLGEKMDDDLDKLMTFELDKEQALVCLPQKPPEATQPEPKADQPAATKPEQPDDAAKTHSAQDAAQDKLMELSSVIHNMLQRPGTIDIEEVMARASNLSAKAPSEASKPEPPRRMSSKQPPRSQQANTGPGEAKQSQQAANATGPGEAKQSQQAANTGPGEAKQSQQAANTGPGEAKQSEQAATTGTGEAKQSEQAANTGPGEAKQSEQAANTGPGEAKQSEQAANTGPKQSEQAANTGPGEAKQSEQAANTGPAMQSEQAANTGPTAVDEADTEAAASNKRKKGKKEPETHEERLKREGHNAYMRFYRSIRFLVAYSSVTLLYDVGAAVASEARRNAHLKWQQRHLMTGASLAATSGYNIEVIVCTQRWVNSSGGTGTMRHLFEQFLTCSEDWQQSAIMMNVRSRKKGSRHGSYVWKKFQTLVEEQLARINMTNSRLDRVHPNQDPIPGMARQSPRISTTRSSNSIQMPQANGSCPIQISQLERSTLIGHVVAVLSFKRVASKSMQGPRVRGQS